MADFRALAGNLGTVQGALAAADEIAVLAERLKNAPYNAEQINELRMIRVGLEHLSSVVSGLRQSVKLRIAELEREFGPL